MNTVGPTNFSTNNSMTSIDGVVQGDPTDPQNVTSPQSTKSQPPLSARSRSNSGDAERPTRNRLSRQNVNPVVMSNEGAAARSNLLRRRRGKDLKPIKTTLSAGSNIHGIMAIMSL